MGSYNQKFAGLPLLSSEQALNLNTVDPRLSEARMVVNKIRLGLKKESNRRLIDAFTALANGDVAVGMLAFYLWRRRARR